MKRLRLAIYISILFLFLIPQFYFLDKRTQSFNFGDENEHLVPAYMMSENNDKLYENLSTNHQPLPIFTAAIFHELIPYTNSLVFIERVRQFVFLISTVGAVILTLRFGAIGLTSSIILESVKFYFFGYHLLAESLVVYSLMYLGATLFAAIQKPQLSSSNTLTKIDSLVIGASLFWIAFNLLPTWPFLAAYMLYYFQVKKPNNFSRTLIFLSLIVPTITLFILIKPQQWFGETIINNYKYFLPHDSQLAPTSIVNLATYPIQSFLHLNQPVAKYYALLTALAIICTISLKFSKKSRAKHTIFGFYFLIILLNLRTTSIDVSFYTAFHLLPQVALLTVLVTYLTFFTLNNFRKTGRKIFITIVTLLFVAIFVNNTTWWRESLNYDKFNEHFIQYGDEESVAMAIATIKNDDDTLLAGPQSGLINIFANTNLATTKIAYLNWSYRTPSLRKDFLNTMENSPPTFIYFPISNNLYSEALQPYLKTKYKRIERTFGSQTNLYILSNKIESRSQKQWKHFSELFYEPPLE